MYTVIRFIAGPAASDSILEEIGSRLNALISGVFKRLDRVGGRFSISVSSDDAWSAHVDAIVSITQRMAEVVCEARAKGISVVLDIAIEPEDVGGKSHFSCEVPIDLMEELVRQEIGLTFTFYGSPS